MALFDDLLARIPEAEAQPSQFHGEPALWIDGREFLHTDGEERVEIRLTQRLIRDLHDVRAAARAYTSDWVVVDAAERDLVLELARRAADANRG